MATTRHAQLVKRIHAARTWLKMDEDTYRELLANHCDGRRSSTDCTVVQLERAMARMHELGYPRPGRRPLSRPQKLMWSLWQQLADAGRVRDRTMAGLLAWIGGQTAHQVKALDWLTPAQENTLIESLKKWKARDGTQT
jgi:hypothetical protein